ncbi:Anaphase-promoting complex (APC) [Forsythia ovata]|uniref:Anaphase-promoting complex (APC) n=1 Tax=Forsythia ovata TaxID=205694 RepID=A0ABD1RZR8_9LAMI
MITLARQTQPTVLKHDNQSIDGDGAARLVQLTSTRTTPSGSRRWMRVFSDTESYGFDSFYGENESNVSFRRYRHFPGEDDTISYTTYGEDSDASIDEITNVRSQAGTSHCNQIRLEKSMTRSAPLHIFSRLCEVRTCSRSTVSCTTAPAFVPTAIHRATTAIGKDLHIGDVSEFVNMNLQTLNLWSYFVDIA